jgi:undecaprenyl-phosphate 4-deoxy-4-formamido-L-arabinose transferase
MVPTEQAGADATGEPTPGLSIVIPLYRDEDSLGPIFERCKPILDEVPGGGELVLVDDGGLDRATPRAIAMAESYPHPTTNFGQHPAVFAGLAHARGKLVATLDSDLQYPPEELPDLIAEVSEDYPVVSGYRADRKDPIMRKFITGGLTRWLNARTGADLKDFGSMFRVYDRRTVDLMLTFEERHRYVPAVVAWLGVPIKEVPIKHAPRGDQQSRYRLSTLMDLLLDLVTGYSVSPLRLLIVLGLVGSLAGFLATLGFGIYRVFAGSGVSGTVSAFALVFALLGILLLLIALIGEYVGRIYVETQNRPYYIVGAVHREAATEVDDGAL